MENLNRRGFIKSSSGLVGAAALTSGVVGKVFAGGSDVIKIALIGCGGRGTGATFDAFASGRTFNW